MFGPQKSSANYPKKLEEKDQTIIEKLCSDFE
jgi:hypothetical protein